MTIYRKLSPSLNYALLISILLFVWMLFAPIQAGGNASYVIVIGKSMEPKFHVGDLIIVHREAQYQKGDAVTYRNQELNSFVFHRIVDQSMGRFTLKGDNNSWLDTYRPTSNEVIGKLWIHIPDGGVFMQKIRDPAPMAILSGLLGLILMSSLLGNTKEEVRMNKKPFWKGIFFEKQNQVPTSSKKLQSRSSNQWEIFENLFFLLGLIAFISVIFGLISFSRPAIVPVDVDLPYGQLGFYSYSTTAPQNIYDANKIVSGDPIFPKLTCTIDVNFQYTLVSAGVEDVQGTYQLMATLIEPNSGWERKIPLQKELTFSGTVFDTKAKLNLCEIETLLQTTEEKTEFHPATYLLEIGPQVNVTGIISGQSFQSSFDPKLTFAYDRLLYRMIENEQGNSLNPSTTSNLTETRNQAAVVSFFGMAFRVSSLRTISLFGIGISILGMTIMGLILWNMGRGNPAALIRLKYDSLIVEIDDTESINKLHRVDITSMDDLVKLAERHNSMIFHEANENMHTFFIKINETVYQFKLHGDLANSRGD